MSTNTQNMTCDICINPFNKTSRKKLENNCCNSNICRECAIKWIMDTTTDAHCMNCNSAYTDDFLSLNFSKNWLNGDKRDRDTNILLLSEKSKLPETQIYLDISNQIDTCVENEKQIDLQLDDLYDQIKTLKATKHKNFRTKHNLERDFYDKTRLPVDNRRDFIFPCPDNTCKGYLSTQFKCKVCDKVTCSKCHKIKLNDHICNDDDIKTVEEIKKSSKPCPRCGCRIHKISGCSQMFCINPGCGTVFNWNTLVIEDNNAIIHNPHVAEYNAIHGTNIGSRNNDRLGLCDVSHANLPSFRRLPNFVERDNDNELYCRYLWNVISMKNHISNVEINNLVNFTHGHLDPDGTIKLRVLRVKYMKNYLSYDEWFKQIKTFKRALKKNNDYKSIFQLAETILNDLLREDLHIFENNRLFTNNSVKYIEAINYINSQFHALNTKYKVHGKMLIDHWNVSTGF